MKLDAATVARIRAQIARYPQAAAIAADVLAEAERIHGEPVLEIEYEPGRHVMLPTSRKLFHRVTTLGIAAALDGRNAHRLRAVRELLAAASFDSWNPGHFLDTAEMIAAASVGLMWFRHFMSGEQAEAIAAAIFSKGLEPGAAQMQAGAFWVRASTNWNVVCCGGLILGAVAVRDRDAERCDAILQQARSAISSGLGAFEPDGGYPEGPGYWEYALKYAVLAIEALRLAGFNETPSPALLRTWHYGMAMTGRSGKVFNIGDTLERLDRSPMLGWLALMSGDSQAAFWQHHSPGKRHALDLLWFAAPTGDIPCNGLAVFEEAGVSVLATPGDTVRMLLKGGSNGANHAHLDLGSILLDMDGVRFVEDIGREDYSVPGYFDPGRRFDYLRTKTSAHSTLHVVGAGQSVDARARLLGSREAGGQYAVAYGIEDLHSPINHRRAAALSHSGQVFVVDEIAAKAATGSLLVQWQIVTRASVSLEDDAARLSRDGIDVLVEILEPRGCVWGVEQMPSPPGQSENSDFVKLCFSVDAGRQHAVVVRFRPVSVPPENIPAILDGWTEWRNP